MCVVFVHIFWWACIWRDNTFDLGIGGSSSCFWCMTEYMAVQFSLCWVSLSKYCPLPVSLTLISSIVFTNLCLPTPKNFGDCLPLRGIAFEENGEGCTDWGDFSLTVVLAEEVWASSFIQLNLVRCCMVFSLRFLWLLCCHRRKLYS